MNSLESYLTGEEIKLLNTPEGKKRIEEKLREIYMGVIRYLPRQVLESKDANEKELREGKQINVSLIFADITGFTTLSERLSRVGKEGSEELTKIINNYFSPILSIIFKHNGDLLRFGGDSLQIAFYDEPDRASKELRAASCAMEIIEFIKNFPEVKTAFGVFPIQFHIGVNTGIATMLELGSEKTGFDYLILGNTVSESVAIGDEAEAGEILLSSSMFEILKGMVSATQRKPGLYELKDIYEFRESVSEEKISEIKGGLQEIVIRIENIAPYIPDFILRRIIENPKSEWIGGEHRIATVLFLNLQGEIEIKRLQEQYKRLKDIVNRYEGMINKVETVREGIRIMIIFGIPHSHEDDQEKACYLSKEIMADKELGKIVTFGVNSGFVFAGNVGSKKRQEYTVMGDEVNLSARLTSHAKAGETIISKSVMRKIVDKWNVSELEPLKVKGKAKEVSAYLLGEVKKKEDIFQKWVSETAFLVGRRDEMETLRTCMHEVLKVKGQIVSITGEPGIGKSRLLREIAKEWMDMGYLVFGGNCVSYGEALSYHPWRDLFEDYLGIKDSDSMSVKENKLESSMVAVDTRLKEWTPIMGEILGIPIPETPLSSSIDAKLRKQRLLDISLQMFRWGAEQEPLMLILEDIHWADMASLELLNYIGRNIKEHSIFLCLVYRSIKEEQEFQKHSHHTEIQLKELESDDGEKLIDALVGGKAPSDFKKFIIEKTQRNPLFIEEVIKSFLETGVIIKEDGKIKISGDIKSLEIPVNIQSVIMSRLDHLTERARSTVQTASVIGREFDYNLLFSIYKERANLSPSIDELCRLDLIQDIMPSFKKEEKKYVFKHVLTQEVAYDSLAFEKKREIHRKIGEEIEKEKAELLEGLGLLSYHFSKGQEWEKALDYSVKAGDRTKQIYSNYESVQFYTTALDVFETMKKEGYLLKEE